jgi:hypothetical protein
MSHFSIFAGWSPGTFGSGSLNVGHSQTGFLFTLANAHCLPPRIFPIKSGSTRPFGRILSSPGFGPYFDDIIGADECNRVGVNSTEYFGFKYTNDTGS